MTEMKTHLVVPCMHALLPLWMGCEWVATRCTPCDEINFEFDAVSLLLNWCTKKVQYTTVHCAPCIVHAAPARG